MSDATLNHRNRIKSFFLLLVCGLFVLAAVAVGIDDNPFGILLAFLAAIAFILALTHPWRTARKFLFLLLASAVAFILFTILSILLDSVTQDPATSVVLKNLLNSPGIDALNLIIVMLCPAALIIGVIGSVVMFIRNRRKPPVIE